MFLLSVVFIFNINRKTTNDFLKNKGAFTYYVIREGAGGL